MNEQQRSQINYIASVIKTNDEQALAIQKNIMFNHNLLTVLGMEKILEFIFNRIEQSPNIEFFNNKSKLLVTKSNPIIEVRVNDREAILNNANYKQKAISLGLGTSTLEWVNKLKQDGYNNNEGGIHSRIVDFKNYVIIEEILNPAKMDLIEYSLPIIKVAKSDLMEKGGFTAEKIRSELSLLFSVSVANTATRTTEEKLSLIKVLI